VGDRPKIRITVGIILYRANNYLEETPLSARILSPKLEEIPLSARMEGIPFSARTD